MKKSIISLAVAALLASPAVVFATEEFANTDIPMTVEDKNGPGASDLAPGAGTYVENIENNEITPRPDGKIAVVEVKVVDGKQVEVAIPAVREEGTGKADAAKDPAAPAVEEAPKAEEKKEEAKPAAKAVKAAATKTASKALPKTSAVK
ncbi:tetrahydromethanopterin S-methyltransferase subunit A [Streptococcus rupicaprae]|uniref:Tetrahydromethanopterin S-methyltransferase subunit A n=1 Tax=Streptococcus rupicaprae TaxID=759619 RepID=A0ABV2FK56_9STRE